MKSKCSFILKASIAMILALIMLFGTVATSIAAVVEDDYAGTGAEVDLSETGDTTYYMHIGVGSAFKTNSAIAFTYDSTNDIYYASYELVSNSEYPMVINTNSGSLGEGDKSSSSQSVTSLASAYNPDSIQFDYFEYGSNKFDGYACFKFKTQTTQTVYFTFASDSSELIVRSTLPSGGGGGGGEDPEEPEEPEEAGTSSDTVTIDGVSNLTQVYYDFSAITTAGGVNMYTTNGLCYDPDGQYGIRLGFLPSNVATSWDIVQTSKNSYTKLKYVDRDENNRIVVNSTGTSPLTWSTYTDFNFAPLSVLEGDKKMFYIQNYTGGNAGNTLGLCTSSSTAAGVTAHRVSKDIGYVIASSTELGTYNHINNNIGNNASYYGVEHTGMASATGGEYFFAGASTTTTPATTATTTAPESIAYGTTTLNISTQASSVHSAIGSNLSSQYYIKVGNTWHKVGTTYTTSTTDKSISLDISSLSLAAGTTYALKTVLTDGGVYYVADTDTFNVLTPETKHAVTITASPAAGGTVTPASGTAVGESTATTITATPEDGYQFSSWTFGTGITGSSTTANPATITTNSSGDYTVEAVFTAKPKHTITVVSSNNIYGTAMASVAEAYEGQSVTLTATENTGTFSKWNLTSGSGTISSSTSKSTTFTMGSSDVTITANFAAYSGTSNFYYNSYGSNGQPASTHYGAQMTEAKLNGETYSYYHVTGRNESDQLFTVSYGSPKYNSYNTYFEIKSDWENGGVSAKFYATDGKNLGDFTGMTYDSEANSKKKFKIAIPDGAREVEFKNNNGGATTGKLSLYSGNNAYYVSGNNLTDVTGYNSSNPVPVNFYENFNGTNKYTNAFNSGGFNDHGANRGESHSYTKPNNLSESQRGDYYILVLYSGKKYTINGVEHTVSLDPEIIWLPTLPDETTDLARIYAKDGCINENRDSTRVIGTTNIVANGDIVKNVSRGSISGNEVYSTARAVKGESITITTEINSTYASKYVVKGWDVNGDTVCLDPTAVGNTYTATFTVPDADKVEITPIYWLKSTYDTTTFFVKDFNKVPSAWGTALYYYYWGGSQVNVDNEERYPGQPFVHAGGQYYAQVPSDVTGVTLNNAVWDDIHGRIMMGLSPDNDYNEIKAAHYQTYDYDNFAKIKKEKTNINSIYFTFKYENSYDNLGSTSASSGTINTGTFTNGWEEYKDPLGRSINIFGGTDVTSGGKVLRVVSNGYARNYQGRFATEWSIYVADSSSATSATFVGTIPGSALILDAAADFDKSEYVTDYAPTLASYKSTWNTLQGSTYKNLPVYITYEKALRYGNSVMHTVSGDTTNDPADRVDGKWDYTSNSDYVTANIIIQKSDDNGATYTTDAFSSGNTGTTTGAQAYFNNAGTAYVNTHEVTTAMQIPVSTTNTFSLKTVPQPSTGYQFVGWYRQDDGSEKPELISKTTEATSLMSAKATFIARYKQVTSGNLVISHLTNGEGTATSHTVKVEVYESGAVVGTDAPVAVSEGDSVTLDDTYINSSSTYKLRVTLTAIANATSYIANNNSTHAPTVACSQDAATYYKNPAYTRTGRFDNSIYPINVKTTVDTFTVGSLYSGTTQNIKLINYTTTINKLPTYTINYKYHGRGQSGAAYLNIAKVITLSHDEAEGKAADGTNYYGNNGTALRPTYRTQQGDGLVNDITANAPDQNALETSVFNKDISWSAAAYDAANATDTAVTIYATESDPEYTLTYTYYDENGDSNTGTYTDAYNTLVKLGETEGTYDTADIYNGDRFSYWADANNNPLTTSKHFSMRLVNNLTIHPVYGENASGWSSAIDKITRTHQTSDSSDTVFTDFALRFSGFDTTTGQFIHINPDYKTKYRIGVALVYDTAGSNTSITTEESSTALYTFPNSGTYQNATQMVQLMANRNLSSAKLSGISATTYASMFDADTNLLTNFNRLDYAVKYDYKTYYKRSYDAYAYIIDTTDTTGGTNGTVVAVSPVKSGYLYDGTLPVGN